MASISVRSDLKIPFPSENLAKVACTTMSVDKEPKRSKVTKTIKLEGSVVSV